METMSNDEHPPLGNSFESFLESEEIRDEVYGAAMKRVRVWELDAVRREERSNLN
jgi:antitoxin HicB